MNETWISTFGITAVKTWLRLKDTKQYFYKDIKNKLIEYDTVDYEVSHWHKSIFMLPPVDTKKHSNPTLLIYHLSSGVTLSIWCTC